MKKLILGILVCFTFWGCTKQDPCYLLEGNVDGASGTVYRDGDGEYEIGDCGGGSGSGNQNKDCSKDCAPCIDYQNRINQGTGCQTCANCAALACYIFTDQDQSIIDGQIQACKDDETIYGVSTCPELYDGEL